VSAPTQDRGASIGGTEVLLVDADSGRATMRATGDESGRLAALGADAHDAVDARDAVVGADRDRGELVRQQRAEERLGRSAELRARDLGGCEDLEPVLHAAGVARGDDAPRTLAAAVLLPLLAARMRDMSRNRHLDAAVGAAREAVRAVRPGQIE